MGEIYKKNMEELERIDKAAYNIIDSTTVNTSNYEVMETKIGMPTIQVINVDSDHLRSEKFLIHSKYDPYKAECSFAEKNADLDCKNLIIYGLGLGYHIELLLERLLEGQRLFIIEANMEIVKTAFMWRDLSNIITHNQVKLIFLAGDIDIENELSMLIGEDSSLVIHQSSAKAIPSRYKNLGHALKDLQMMRRGIERNQDLLLNNYINNTKIKYQNICTLFERSGNFPIIIVSAGPSLNKNKHLLHKIKGKALIFAVGSALKTLLEEGIEPDLFCIIDPQSLTYKQIERHEELSIPMVFLDTASHFTVSKYKGPKYIASNDIERIGFDEQIIETGGSVATAILDISVKLGGNPIIFIGQDLAFTGSEHHAKGSMYGEEETIKNLPNLKKVKGYDGKIHLTSSSLLSFKNWIERKIENHPEILFVNATESGAMIIGCIHISLEIAINLYLKENSKELQEFLYVLNFKR